MKTPFSHKGVSQRVLAPTPRIAVIVPNRNDSRHLPGCLRSLLEQEDPPDEVIVVDDQSTDDSVSVIRSLIAGHRQARLVENPVNLGTYGALDRGLEVSRSEYVLFLSANDAVMPGVFTRARSCLARHPEAGAWSAMGWLVDEEGRLIRMHASPVVSLRDTYLPPERCARLAHRVGNWFVGATLIYRRDAVESAGKFDAAYMGLADLVTTLVVADRHGVAYSPQPFGVSRIHPGSYLSRTLTDTAKLDGILDRLHSEGASVAPRMFSAAFLERAALRFRFASIRASRGQTLAHTAGKHPGARRLWLIVLDRALPRSLYRARVATAFLVMCPFDVVPAVWNRLLGSWVVRLMLRLRGQGAYREPARIGALDT